MRLQLKHVFTGKGMRRREVQRQALVDRRAIGIRKRQVGGFACAKVAAQPGAHQGREVFAADAHDAHRTPAGSGGDGDDGVVLAAEHGLQVQWAGYTGSRRTKGRASGPWCGKRKACAYLNDGRLNCGGTPMRVLISHCCAIDKMLFVIQ